MSVEAALDLLTAARAENARGRHAAAAQTLQQALSELALTPDDPRFALARARVLITRAWTLAELHGLDRGLAQLQEVYDVVDAGALSAAEARSLRTPLHNQHGLLLLRAGRVDDAIVQFDTAEQWFEHAQPLDRCNVLLNRGALAINVLDIVRARADLSRCAEIAGAAELPLLQFKAQHNLGYLEFLAGDLPRSLAAMEDAASIDAEHQRGVDLIDRARVLMEAGLTRDADEALGDAITLLDDQESSTHDLAEATLERARCRLQALDWEASLELARAAERRYVQRGNARRAETAALVGLMSQVALGRHDERSIAAARDLAEHLSAEGLPSDARTATVLAARLLIDSGEIAEAQALVDGLGAVRPDERIGPKLLHRLVRAELAFATGQLPRGRREIRLGLAELSTHRARFGGIDAQTAGAVHGVALSELDLATACRTGRPLAVFAAVERSRALSGGMAAVTPPSDPVAAAALAELRRISRTLQSDTVARDELPGLHARRIELQQLIKARQWRQPGSAERAEPDSFAAVSAALEELSAGMIVYFTTGGQVHALPLGATSSPAVAIGPVAEIAEQVLRVRADLDMLASPRHPEPFARAARRSLTRALNDLDERLLRPLGAGSRPLVVVPTGLLATLPWSMLPSLRGVPMTVAPSATSWRRGQQTALRLSADSAVHVLAGPQLGRGADEVTDVATRWTGSQAFIDKDATAATLLAALRTGTLVHVAAHGRHDATNPLFSALSLADGQIFGYDLVSEVGEGIHVVLSACELGLATVRPGDEPLGLTRALLHYGAATVVSGVARVADDVAADVMTRHHRYLSAGMSPAAALSQATDTDDIAPFVCFGSGLG
ncbi:MAG TPA: CHAT domain-containing protein [Jatrophihabitantaceae bacterium]